MEEQDDKLIERYYLNDLSEAELVDFQRRLKEDEAFWEAVHLHADALEAIRLEGIALLRRRLTAKGRELDVQNPGKTGRKWLWILPVLLLCAFGVWLLLRISQNNNADAKSPVQNNSPVMPADTLPPASPPENEAREQPKQNGQNDRQIFAANFRPYRDESLEPSVRGNAAPSPSERFQQLYWDGDYRAALAAFDSLNNYAQKNDNLLFLKANCLLEAGSGEEAADLLENIIRNGRSRFSVQAPWYLALSRLQTGRRKEAEVLLRRIATDPDSPRQADARKLLRGSK